MVRDKRKLPISLAKVKQSQAEFENSLGTIFINQNIIMNVVSIK